MVQGLEIEDGKVKSISLTGNALELVKLAVMNVENAKAKTERIQRPLERKFTSIIEKLKALQGDLIKHQEYLNELQARKEERQQLKDLKEIMAMGGMEGWTHEG
ncbi:MAG: hypothetical protein HUK20_11775 [Fibrobacter sp.]|nr:hypothetical protein [Fibrobacter sp.]